MWFCGTKCISKYVLHEIEIGGGTGAPYAGIQMSVLYPNDHSEVLCSKAIVFTANHLEIANKYTLL